jgi:NitT/TauT family transport system substrate-binding protein
VLHRKLYFGISILFLFIFSLFVFSTGCAPAQQDNLKIRIGYLQSDLHHLPAFVAVEKKYFQDAGLNVEVAGVFRAGPELMSAFAANELDIGYVGLAPAITAVANGTAAVRYIAQVNREGSAIVVAKDAPYNKVADLQGKVVTIPGHATMQDFLLRKAFKNEDVPFNKIKLLVLKPPEMIPALDKGDIDAFIAWEPYPAKAVTGNTGRVLMSSHAIWPDHPCCVVVTADAFLKEHSEVIKKIQDVHKRACDFISSNQEQAIDIGVKYTGMDRPTVQKAITAILYNGELKKINLSEFVVFLKELRYIKPDISENNLINNFTPG